MSTPQYVILSNGMTCGWCERTDVSKQDLKQCGGCAAVRYCSKDCQRRAWPAHKSSCRSRKGVPDAGMQQAGYTAPLSLANAVKDWANIHDEGFSMIVHAYLRLNGGADKALKEDKAIAFQLRPLERVFDDPATALGITGFGLVSKDEDDELIRDHWEEPLIAARDACAAHLARTAPNPRFAGVIPVTFFVENAKVILHSQHALYRPRNHADDAPVDERMAAAFDDLRALCVRSVCFGLVLRDSANPVSAPFPDVGYMMREKKKWVWTPSLDPADVFNFVMNTDERPRRSDLSVRDLWTLWRQW